MAHTQDDAQLLESIRNDEPGAFEDFVDRFGDRIYSYGMRMCGVREDAQDVFQETMIQAYRKLRQLEHPGALKSWLYRVASNACLMKRRKGKFEPARELSLEELMPKGGSGPAIEIPDPASLPDEELSRSELRGILRDVIDELPQSYRVVLVMRDLEHLSTKEVAQALELSETAVKMRLHRGRLMARTGIEERLLDKKSGGAQ